MIEWNKGWTERVRAREWSDAWELYWWLLANDNEELQYTHVNMIDPESNEVDDIVDNVETDDNDDELRIESVQDVNTDVSIEDKKMKKKMIKVR